MYQKGFGSLHMFHFESGHLNSDKRHGVVWLKEPCKHNHKNRPLGISMGDYVDLVNGSGETHPRCELNHSIS